MASGSPSKYRCPKCGKGVSEYSYFHRKDPCNLCNRKTEEAVNQSKTGRTIHEMFPRDYSSQRRKR